MATHSSILALRIPWTVYSPWGHKESDTSVLHAFLQDLILFHYYSILFLDLRLKSSHFPHNDRQNDTLQQITLLFYPLGTTGVVLTQKCFDMYSGGRSLGWPQSRGWAELPPVAGRPPMCQEAWLLFSETQPDSGRKGGDWGVRGGRALLDADPKTRGRQEGVGE